MYIIKIQLAIKIIEVVDESMKIINYKCKYQLLEMNDLILIIFQNVMKRIKTEKYKYKITTYIIVLITHMELYNNMFK